MVTYNVATPEEYLAVLDRDWRLETLLDLRAIILATAPDWQEVIHYKMLGYGEKGRPVLHLNAQMNFVGLYVGDVAIVDPDGTLLGDIGRGKGCVRFRRRDRINESGAKEFIERYVVLKRQGVSFDC